jgi:hypothetical protein
MNASSVILPLLDLGKARRRQQDGTIETTAIH